MNDWKTYKLGDLIVVNKFSITKDYSFDEIEYIDTSSVTENRFSEFKVSNFKEAPSRAKRIVNDLDILYSTVRPNQRHYGIVKKSKPNLIASTGFAVISSKNINPVFILLSFSK